VLVPFLFQCLPNQKLPHRHCLTALMFFVGQGQTSVRRRSAVLFYRYVSNGHHTTQVQRDILLLGGRCNVFYDVHDAVLAYRPLSLNQHG